MKADKSLTIIVPCHNEEEVLKDTYSEIKSVMDELSNKCCLLFINDGSTDKTRYLLNQFSEMDERVKVIHFSRNFGHQSAVTAGIHYTESDLAIIMDADLQDSPKLIPDLLKLQSENDADVVYCVRKEREGETWLKKQIAKLFYRIFNALTDIDMPLDTGDFRLINSKVIAEVKKFKEHGKYVRGIISWIGFKQIPFYYCREPRKKGKTKYPFLKMWHFGVNAILYFSKKPLLIATWLGFISVVVGLFLAIWFTFAKIYGFGNAEIGWTSIMISILFFGGVQLLTVGVLGQYIGVLFDEVKSRPEYIIDEKRNFTN